ncbi:MAG: CRISPR-associated protein Cas4 [Promethearchaeota archaeon]
MGEEPEIVDSLSLYKVSAKELGELRDFYPHIHLFLMPYIGTEDIRQYKYCKRKLFFRYILNAPMKKTYKMEVGQEKHMELQLLKEKSKDKSVDKYFNIYLTDHELSLVGLIDYFEFDGDEAYPVEIKSGHIIYDKGVSSPDISQAIAQALLIERNFNFLVKKVKIAYIKEEKIVDYTISIEDKLKIIKVIREVQNMLFSEQMPPPIEFEGRCSDCECRSYCLRR